MTTKKKNMKKNSTGQSRKSAKGAGGNSGRIPKTGLTGFLLDASEDTGKVAFATLAKAVLPLEASLLVRLSA